MALKALFTCHLQWGSSLIVITCSTLQLAAGEKKKVCIPMFEHMLLCRSTTTEVSSAATLGPPSLSSSPLPISSPSSLPVAPRNDLILIQTHFVQLPYMGEIAGMGPVDYALPPLCLFYLMPKTADNFKNLGQLIMRTIFFPLVLSFAALCICSIPHVIWHPEPTCWKMFHGTISKCLSGVREHSRTDD